MGQHRYHIHVCLVKNEQPEFENAWQIASTNEYFLTWDLWDMTPAHMSYSRQQIERCDSVLFVLDDSYGQLSPSGVSFLHLCYIFATTKRKPFFALIKQPADYHERRRADLADLIEKEHPNHIAHYHNTQEAVKMALAGLQGLKPTFANAGWIQNTTGKKHPRAQETLFAPKPSPELTQDTIKSSRKKLGNTAAMLMIGEATDTASASLLTNNSNMLSSDNSAATIPILPSETLVVSDTIMISYSAQAYQGGNLSDIMLTHSFSWQEIIDALKSLPEVFSPEMIVKKFNELLSQTALAEAMEMLPNAHAVSRCQINTLDFHWVKKQLANHHFLLKVTDERGTRELWQLNPQVK